MPDENNVLICPSKNSSCPAFYKKYRSVLQYSIEKKFLDLGLETAPKMYTSNINDPSITMEYIYGVRPMRLNSRWFKVLTKQLEELNEVAEPDGWWGFSNGVHYHITENQQKLSYVRNIMGNTEEVQDLNRQLTDEINKIKNMPWNNDNKIIGSFDYGPHNTIEYKGEYRLIDFEYVSHLELSTFAAKLWNQTHRHFHNMFGVAEDDTKLIEELSKYQVNDAWIEQYQSLKPIWRVQDRMWELVHKVNMKHPHKRKVVSLIPAEGD